MLAESVGMRLREIRHLAYVVEVWIRYKNLHGFTRQKKLAYPTDITRQIIETSEELFIENYDFCTPIRSLGVRVTNLIPQSRPVQLNFFEDAQKNYKEHSLEHSIDNLRYRFGNNIVRKGITIGDEMSSMDIKKDNTIHPLGYFG